MPLYNDARKAWIWHHLPVRQLYRCRNDALLTPRRHPPIDMTSHAPLAISRDLCHRSADGRRHSRTTQLSLASAFFYLFTLRGSRPEHLRLSVNPKRRAKRETRMRSFMPSRATPFRIADSNAHEQSSRTLNSCNAHLNTARQTRRDYTSCRMFTTF